MFYARLSVIPRMDICYHKQNPYIILLRYSLWVLLASKWSKARSFWLSGTFIKGVLRCVWTAVGDRIFSPLRDLLRCRDSSIPLSLEKRDLSIERQLVHWQSQKYPSGCHNNKGGFVDWADIFSHLYSCDWHFNIWLSRTCTWRWCS